MVAMGGGGGAPSSALLLVRQLPGSALVLDSLGVTVPAWLLGLFANAFLLAGSFWIVRYGFRQACQTAACLGTIVVFWTACTIGLEFLSAFGAIAAGPLLSW